MVALPELYGPGVRGVPLSEHGFYRVDIHGKLVDAEHIYAAGDATEFAVKFGGIAAQQADALAEAIAARGRRRRDARAVSPGDPRHPAHRRASRAT